MPVSQIESLAKRKKMDKEARLASIKVLVDRIKLACGFLEFFT